VFPSNVVGRTDEVTRCHECGRENEGDGGGGLTGVEGNEGWPFSGLSMVEMKVTVTGMSRVPPSRALRVR
jgi:hypothetical protein